MFTITHEYFRHLQCKNEIIKMFKTKKYLFNNNEIKIPKYCSSQKEVIKIINTLNCSN